MKARALLLVEDNPQDELLILRVLHKHAVAVDIRVARDGQQAVDYLFASGEFAGRDPAELPSLVLLDIGLPRLSGIEVLQRLRADPRTELLPVVVFTSSDEERDRVQSYRHGVNSYVRKPLDFAEFSETVTRLGMYWLHDNAQPDG